MILRRIAADDATATTAHGAYNDRCADDVQNTNAIADGTNTGALTIHDKTNRNVSVLENPKPRYLQQKRNVPGRFTIQIPRMATNEDEPWRTESLNEKKNVEWKELMNNVIRILKSLNCWDVADYHRHER